MTTVASTLRYMTRFRCLAERCEDTCCQGLRVPLSAERLGRLRTEAASRGESPWLEERLEAGAEGPAQARAYLRLGTGGHCAFLEAERTCSLHRRYGEAVLPEVCSLFPRVAMAREGRLEVSGALGCPEVARLCLLAEDAVERVEAPADLLPRPVESAAPGQEAGEVCAKAFRQVALRLVERSELPLASWVVALGQLALHLEELCVGSMPLESLRAAATELVQRFEEPGLLAALHRDFSAVELPGGPMLELYAQVLRARLEAGRGQRFEGLARGVLESLGLVQEGGAEQQEAAWRVYLARWAWLEESQGERVRQYFRHFLINYLWNQPLGVPGLVEDVLRMALRLGLMRVALAAHPGVAALCEREQGEAEHARAELDAAAVECFQLMTRHLAYSPGFSEVASSLAGSGGMESLRQALVVAKLVEVGSA